MKAQTPRLTESLWPACAGPAGSYLKAQSLVEEVTPRAPYVESKWFSRYQVGFFAVALGGGVAMLLIAALARDSASIPLLVMGTGWTVIGLDSMRRTHRTFRAVRFEDGVVTFISPGRSMSIPAAEIIEVRRARGDLNRFMPLKAVTSNNGTLAVSPRLNGLIELLVELRKANPALRVDHL